MLSIWILSAVFLVLVSGDMINDLITAGQQPMLPQNHVNYYDIGNKGTPNIPINDLVAVGKQPMLPQNLVPSSLNYNTGNQGTTNYPGVPLPATPNSQNSRNATDRDCPNTALLSNILNILINLLPKCLKYSEPEKLIKTSPVTYTEKNDLKNPNGIQNPLFYLNPGSMQAPSLNPNFDVLNGKNLNVLPSNVHNNPIINTEPWQNVNSGLKGLSEDTYNKQQFIKYLTKNSYEGNLAVSSSLNPSVKQPPLFENGQIAPTNIGGPNTDQNHDVYTNPNINKNAYYIDQINLTPTEQNNLLHRNIKITPSDIANPTYKMPYFIGNNGITNLQNLQDMHNLNAQSTLQQHLQYKNPNILPSQSIDLNQYRPVLQVKNQLLNPNGLGYNQISPLVSLFNANFNNVQNLSTDNSQRGNYGRVLDLNHLLGVSNLGKLNTIPHHNSIVELTYMLKKPKPVYESQYYVKYRLPYQTFLYNLQNVLVRKPNLRNEPSHLYHHLLVGSNVTDTSKDLKGLNYDEILKLTSTNGTLVTAKILKNNDTLDDRTLKIVQNLNSKLPVENIISFNLNTTKNIRLETQKNINGSKSSSDVNIDVLNNVNPLSSDVQRRFPQYLYNTFGQNPYRFQVNPYSVYQSKPVGYIGLPLKYGSVLPSSNIIKNPTYMINPQYIANNPQFGR